DRHRRGGEEALDDRLVPAVEGPPRAGGDLQEPEELAAVEERRAEQARRRPGALPAGGVEQPPEGGARAGARGGSRLVARFISRFVSRFVSNHAPDAGRPLDLLDHLARHGDLVADEGALALRPDDLLRLDAEGPGGGLPGEEGRGVVVVDELVEAVEDLI